MHILKKITFFAAYDMLTRYRCWGGDNASTRPLHSDRVRHCVSVWQNTSPACIRADSYCSPEPPWGVGESRVWEAQSDALSPMMVLLCRLGYYMLTKDLNTLAHQHDLLLYRTIFFIQFPLSIIVDITLGLCESKKLDLFYLNVTSASTVRFY